MKTLLQINTSLFSGEGQSSKLAERYVARWRAANPDGRVIVRDLATDPVPHLTADTFAAFAKPAAERDGAQALSVAYSDALVAELARADVVVIGLPMYNFGVPSTLKAYFDHIARAGVTFRYTERGPIGLLTGKRAVVFATRGGRHVGQPSDTETGFVRTFLAFVGIDDVEFVYAEGLAYGPEARTEAVAAAEASINALVPATRLAA